MVIDVLWGAGGMVALMGIAWLCSTDRRAVRPRTVVGALALQVGFGVLVLSWSVGGRALEAASSGVQAVIDSSREGIGFLFGPVLPAEDQGTVVAFQVLPVIVFFASLTAVLYHLGVLQRVVEVFGGGLGRLLGTGREESVNAAANIFVGQTEAPLLIRPYVAGLTRSQLFAVMVGGLSTVAGSVLVGYSLLGARLDYLIAASFMAAPGALLMAKIMLPEPLEAEAGDESSTAGAAGVVPEQEAPAEEPAEEPERARNVIDAAANGAADGLKLAATIGAMLLAFISLIALVNLIVGGIGDWFGAEDLSVQQLLGYLFAPVMSLIGVPWGDRLRQHRLARHPARRAGRHRPRAASRHRLARAAGHPGRHPGEPDERRDRRHPDRLTPPVGGGRSSVAREGVLLSVVGSSLGAWATPLPSPGSRPTRPPTITSRRCSARAARRSAAARA